MKNLFLISSLILSFAISALSNHTNPTTDGPNMVIDNVELSLTITNQSDLISSTSFTEGADYFTIETKKNINFLQVVNEKGEVEYQLPIGAKVLRLALPDFEKGTFQINLLVEGQENFISTELVKKN